MTDVVTTKNTSTSLVSSGNGDKHQRNVHSYHMESVWRLSQSTVGLGDTWFIDIRQAPLNAHIKRIWLKYRIVNANVAATEMQSLPACTEPKLYINGSSELLNLHTEDVKDMHLVYKTDTFQAGKDRDELTHYNYRKTGSYGAYNGLGFEPITVPGSSNITIDDDLTEYLPVLKNLPLDRVYDIKIEFRTVNSGDSNITHYINQNASDISFDSFECFAEYEVFVRPQRQPAMAHQWFYNLRRARVIPASEHGLDTGGVTYSIEMDQLFSKLKNIRRIFIWTQGNASAADKHTSYWSDFIDKVEVFYMGDRVHERSWGDSSVGKRRLKHYAQEYHKHHNGGYLNQGTSGLDGHGASPASSLFLDYTSIFNAVPNEQYHNNTTVTNTNHNDMHNLRIDITSDSTGAPSGEALHVAVEYLSEIQINASGGVNKVNIN